MRSKRHALARLARRVINVLPLQHAGKTECKSRARRTVGHDLESQRRKRLIVRSTPQNWVIAIGVSALDRRNPTELGSNPSPASTVG